jgi:hypothetical protein
MIEKKAKRESISTNTETTWNVLFIGLGNDDTINSGKKRFLNDLKSARIDSTVRTFYLDFPHETPIGDATITLFQGSNNLKSHTLQNFDSHNTSKNQDKTCYADYFDFVNEESSGTSNNKYILIVLAHSFGTGLAATPRTAKQKSSYLKIKDLVDLIDKQISVQFECVLAVNCTLQTIENNFLFSKITKYLIGSQQPLYVKSIGYKRLLQDLSLIPTFGNSSIFSKLIFETADPDLNIELAEDIIATSNFNITITKPAAAYLLMLELNYLSKLLKWDEDTITKSNKSILASIDKLYDATDAYTLHMYDAVSFFELMLLEFNEPSKINKCLKRILNVINRLVILNHSNSQNIRFYKDPINSQQKFFVPNGIGITLPKTQTPSVIENIKNHSEILKQFEGKITESTITTWAKFVESWIDDDKIDNDQLLSNNFDSLLQKLSNKAASRIDLAKKLWIRMHE